MPGSPPHRLIVANQKTGLPRYSLQSIWTSWVESAADFQAVSHDYGRVDDGFLLRDQ
jgi:hypothetical protein